MQVFGRSSSLIGVYIYGQWTAKINLAWWDEEWTAKIKHNKRTKSYNLKNDVVLSATDKKITRKKDKNDIAACEGWAP